MFISKTIRRICLIRFVLLILGRNLISFYKLDKDNTKETLKLNPIEFLNECLIYKTDDEDSLCSIQEYLSYYKIG